ncbi:PaaI family thioesterase [Priestia megaterium]|jgi:acyl-coenzyme A thioesterase PaaI-like protein|uniref:Thioesterase superfamily protein n=1 Tax=Priestia megaterium (strain ATCC 14581 / DSM 32 / CCUG 1817 / JCM 2506 / NBRC 15308 / NCIMB 9376 / NCTC 10342 / NRRL B-14308 / VKM B-512 / Ford 19) TaxID=1348623 RepID=A0A0B6ASV0_PRIM2|nr:MULTISPECIES: hotdog fold domain-containing protein [Priestia]AJI23783.1 thioesterase superfamily protein [Priestia megaterium NBRC 15308 = ATCC 14581]KFM97227.1 thioesterase superfamily protein [Priestia megaterium]KGJ85215.1 thioesterase [Priestia megaterium NBRC 15308 = ATCC 14581]MBY0199727.1 PaaI family thioesterase [Priestia megaterium]MCU7709768.1 hotdog fold thioesterase [Priestia megaterium]
MGKVVKAIQDEYPDDFAWCYGCGRLNQEGYHFRTGWLGEKTITLYTPKPEHTAIPGFVYGGLLASLIDCHGTGSASLALYRKNGYEIGDSAEPPRFVTGSLHVDFKKPTPQGEVLKAIGTVEEIHPKKWRVKTEVYASDIIVATGEVVAVVMPSTFKQKED